MKVSGNCCCCRIHALMSVLFPWIFYYFRSFLLVEMHRPSMYRVHVHVKVWLKLIVCNSF